MSKDIRSFFSSAKGSKKDTPKKPAGTNSDVKSKGTAKRLIVLSDSDSDEESIIPSSLTKRCKVNSEGKSSKLQLKKRSPIKIPKKEQEPVNPADIFGRKKVKRSVELTSTSVCSPPEETAQIPTKRKKKKGVACDEPGWDDSISDANLLSTLDELEAQATKCEGNSSAAASDKLESIPIKISEENGQTMLTLTIQGATREGSQPKQSKSGKKCSISEDRGELVDQLKLSSKKTKNKKDKKDRDNDVSLEESNSTKKAPDIEASLVEETLPEEQESDQPSWANDPAEKRRLSAIGYQQYLNREGPKHPGSKQIPQGNPSCLNGLVFVISGVLDSLERDDAVELIQNCGGKVTTSVSRKTSYILLGEEAGPSKIHKAEQCGTKQLDEDGLLDLIRSKSEPATASAGGAETTSQYFKSPERKDDRKLSKKSEGTSPSKSASAIQAKSFYGTPGKDKRKSSKPEVKNSSNIAEISPKPKLASSGLKSTEISPKPKLASSRSKLAEISRKPELASPMSKLTEISPKPKLAASGSKLTEISSEPELESSSSHVPAESLMWVDKYRPMSTKQIIGQQMEGSNMKRLTTWLQNWHSNRSKKIPRPSPWARKDDGAYFKAALLSGPPGVGKTTTAHLVCKELGLDVVEFNASDTRGQKRLRSEVAELLSTKSLHNYFQGGATTAKHVLIMDEIDGMAGTEDRGGIQELMQLIKTSKVPIICMCNNRQQTKLRAFVNHCFDLKFEKPRLEQIRGALMSICFKEGVKVTPAVLGEMIMSSSQDVRQVLHHLSMYAKRSSSERPASGEVKQLKNIKLGPWEVAAKVFSAKEHKTMSMNDKSDLFFYDYGIASMFVQENYLHVAPDSAQNDKFKRLDLIAEAADSLCWGDVVEKTIRSRTDAWSLLPTQAMFSSVVPGDLLSGTVTRQLGFPKWLGRNSSRVKHSRLEQELHSHTRLATSGSREAFNLDYLRPLRDALVRPLLAGDPAESVAVMQAYHLMRSDLDSILDINVWPNEKNPMARVDSKMKAAFTRLLNKEGAMLPYSQDVVSVSKIRASAMTGGDDDDEDFGYEENEDDGEVPADLIVKAKKPVAAKKARGKEAGAGGSKTKGGKGKGKSK